MITKFENERQYGMIYFILGCISLLLASICSYLRRILALLENDNEEGDTE